jgi:hypothetical protein
LRRGNAVTDDLDEALYSLWRALERYSEDELMAYAVHVRKVLRGNFLSHGIQVRLAQKQRENIRWLH